MKVIKIKAGSEQVQYTANRDVISLFSGAMGMDIGLAEAIGRAIIATADKQAVIETKRFRGTDIHNRIKNAIEFC